MLEILGAPHRLCNGVSRRDALKIGTLGAAGLTLTDLFRLRAEAGVSAGRAKSIIMVHLNGGPSHIDTYDPKPEAPSQIRGEFKAIPTKVDGIQIGELFPLQAAMMDQLSLIRTIYRGVDEHSSSHTVSGYSNMERKNQGDKPSIGSVLSRTIARTDVLVPPYVSLRGLPRDSGLGAGYLGAGYEPLASNGSGRGDLKLRIKPERLESRKKLLAQMDNFRRDLDNGGIAAMDEFSQKAMNVVSSTATYDALDISKERDGERKRYGNDNFLLARRLIEAGTQCVALETGGWDTHSNNFKDLRRLMPALDKAVSALITDLKDRGLYESTILVVWGEFGRTPRVNGTAGRDHWSRVMSAMVAGGGLKMGQAVGSTDTQGNEPAEGAVRIRDVIATLYHGLGIDPKTEFIDQQNRPITLIPDGEPIRQLCAD